MNCPIETPEHAERLLAYCARKLDDRTAAALERHLRNCAACAEWIREQKAVWGALDQWEAAPVSADFDRRLYRRIQEEVSWWDVLMRPLRPLLAGRGLPVAAAVALVIAAGLLLQRPGEAPRYDAPRSADASTEQLERALDDMEMLRELNHLARPERPPQSRM